jgi:hypothetical protein
LLVSAVVVKGLASTCCSSSLREEAVAGVQRHTCEFGEELREQQQQQQQRQAGAADVRDCEDRDTTDSI